MDILGTKSAGVDAANVVAKAVDNIGEDVKETAAGLEATVAQVTDKGLAALGDAVSQIEGLVLRLDGATLRITGVSVTITDPVVTFNLGQYKPTESE